jgi:hypothetical protein
VDGTLAKFDYSEFEADDAGRLTGLAERVRQGTGAYVDAALELGEALSHAQAVMANRDRTKGLFGKWLEDECGLNRSSAYRYLNSYYGKQRMAPSNGASCPSLGQPTPLSLATMEVLGRDSTPAAAVAAAKKIIGRGDPLTEQDAKELIKEAKEESFDPSTFAKTPVAVAAVNPTSRKNAVAAIGKLNRALKVLDIFDEYESVMSQMEERVLGL